MFYRNSILSDMPPLPFPSKDNNRWNNCKWIILVPGNDSWSVAWSWHLLHGFSALLSYLPDNLPQQDIKGLGHGVFQTGLWQLDLGWMRGTRSSDNTALNTKFKEGVRVARPFHQNVEKKSLKLSILCKRAASSAPPHWFCPLFSPASLPPLCSTAGEAEAGWWCVKSTKTQPEEALIAAEHWESKSHPQRTACSKVDAMCAAHLSLGCNLVGLGGCVSSESMAVGMWKHPLWHLPGQPERWEWSIWLVEAV